MAPKDRIFGLDLLRATAVMLVVFHHSLSFVIAPAWLTSFAWCGEIGVGALLVLSGYLIGNGLIRKSEKGRFSQFSHLSDFYMRRWTRTFPPYFFYLLIMCALFPPFLANLAAHKEYFLFLQNFAWNQPAFYSQTWTLTVLEFFYLLFPLLFLLAAKITRHRLLTIAIPMAILFFIPILLRSLHTGLETATGFDQTFRKWVVYRIDTPIIGVAAALVEAKLPFIWAWLLRNNWVGFCSFSVPVVYHYLNCPGLYSHHWIQVVFYPLSALALVPLLPILCNWKSNLSWFGHTMSSVSQVSYSLYVSHFVAFTFGVWILAVVGIPRDQYVIAYGLYAILLVVIVCPSYYLMEAPFIAIREGKTRSLFERVGTWAGQISRALSQILPWGRSVRPLVEQPPV